MDNCKANLAFLVILDAVVHVGIAGITYSNFPLLPLLSIGVITLERNIADKISLAYLRIESINQTINLLPPTSGDENAHAKAVYIAATSSSTR